MYPDRLEVRHVSANGSWNRGWVNVSTVCIGEPMSPDVFVTYLPGRSHTHEGACVARD
jgi:hypothetical protein